MRNGEVPLLSAGERSNTKHKTLEEFAREVEAKLIAAHGVDAAARYVCRLLTHKDPRIAALMWKVWVEWRYGKAREHPESAQGNTIQIINYVPRPGELDSNCRPADELPTDKPSEHDTIVLAPEPKRKQ